MSTEHFDIAILGGGPAGAVLCRELRRMGHGVALVAAPRPFPAFEGFAERALKGLAWAGCERALAAVGPRVARSARWNGTYFAGNVEHLVDRQSFDRALLDDIRASGAQLHAGRVQGTHPLDDGAGWQIEWRAADGAVQRLRAGYLVDARGRRAPRSGLTWRRGPASVCIARRWRYPRVPEPLARVETFEDGWMWFARDARGEAMLQFFLCAERGPLPAGERLPTHYTALLERLPQAGELLRGAAPVAGERGGVHLRDAGTSLCAAPMGERQARVGEAALSIDPLAGHGVFEAVGGALALAVSLNTLLRRPQRAALAQRFYSDRLGHDFIRMARTGRDFYAMEQRWADGDFWAPRRAWPDDLPAHPGLSGEARVSHMPVADGDLVEAREVLVTADQPRGIWQVQGVPLVALLRELGKRRSPQQALAAVAADTAPDADPQAALAWLRHRGLLRDDPPPSADQPAATGQNGRAC